MNYIEWKNDYYVGVASIDNQHKHLVELINRLLKAQNEHTEKEVVKDIFSELIDYTKIHFEDEEKHMLANRYPGYLEHMRQHKILINQIVEVLTNSKTAKLEITLELKDMLINWLTKHILRHDKDYGSFLKERHIRS